MKQKILSLAILLLGLLQGLSASEPTALRLLFADGSDKWFVFDKQPVVTFSDSQLTVTTSDDTFAYTFADIAEFRFGDPDSDGLADRHAITPRIVQADDAVLVYGTDVNGVSLYDLSGRRLAANVRAHGDAASVSLRALPAGTYIIRINHQSIKVTKK